MPQTAENHLTDPIRNHGFTLIELLVVVAIIGILAAIAIPKLLSAIDKAKVSAAMGDIGAIQEGIMMYKFDNNQQLPPDLATLKTSSPPYYSGNLNDPYGNPYEYLNFKISTTGKRTYSGGSLNSDYDLYSKGKDELSGPGLGLLISEDDIIRGHDGSVVGLGKDLF